MKLGFVSFAYIHNVFDTAVYNINFKHHFMLRFALLNFSNEFWTIPTELNRHFFVLNMFLK